MFNERKQEEIANLRQNLWKAVHERFPDGKKISLYCKDLKKYLPDDFQANFYEIVCSGDAVALNKFIDNVDLTKNGTYAEDVIEKFGNT